MHIDKDICDLLVMGIKKDDTDYELVTRKTSTQSTPVSLSLWSSMTMTSNGQRISVIFSDCELEQRMYASLHNPTSGNGCAVSDRSAFVKPRGFFVSVCVMSKAYNMIQHLHRTFKEPLPRGFQ